MYACITWVWEHECMHAKWTQYKSVYRQKKELQKKETSIMVCKKLSIFRETATGRQWNSILEGSIVCWLGSYAGALMLQCRILYIQLCFFLNLYFYSTHSNLTDCNNFRDLFPHPNIITESKPDATNIFEKPLKKLWEKQPQIKRYVIIATAAKHSSCW